MACAARRSPRRSTPGAWALRLVALAAAGCASAPPPSCGAKGEACCDGTACNAGLICAANLCAVVESGSSSGTTGGTTGQAAVGSTSGGSSSGTATASGTSGSGTTTGTGTGGTASGSSTGGTHASGGTSTGGGATAEVGTPCRKNSDCSSGICLPVGQPDGGQPSGAAWTGNVCSATCTSAAGCISGWSCGPLAGQSSDVCRCTYTPEICDGNDNDCNGVVDDEPAVDLACTGSALGSCINGRCSCWNNAVLCPPCGIECCPAGQGCQDQCTDLLVDDYNCGGCGIDGGGELCGGNFACSGGQCCEIVGGAGCF